MAVRLKNNLSIIKSRSFQRAAFFAMKTLPSKFQLESARCRYRQPTRDDAYFSYTASQQPGFTDGMLWDPPASVEELYPNFKNTLDAWNSGKAFGFTIVDRKTEAFIGRISIRHQQENQWDFGFWTHPEKQNQGYMTEAIARVMRFGFEELEADDIIAKHACWNKASGAVMMKNGMTFRRHIPKGFMKRGEWVEENELGITRSEWLARPSE